VTRVALALVVLLAVGGCDGQEAGRGARAEDVGSELEDVPLREDEAPEGLEASEEGTGPISSIREVLPSRTSIPNLPPIPPTIRQGFEGGFEVLYLRAEGQIGPSSVSSSAVRFGGEDAARAFLTYLREVQVGAGRGQERVEVTVSGLGDGAFGWHLEEPLAESSTVAWRTGDLVLTVTVAGRIGVADPERAVALARTVGGRVGPSAGDG
jgi:hypothetical protein